MSAPAATPEPPYYAVIFTSILNEGDNGYGEMAQQMLKLAAGQPGQPGSGVPADIPRTAMVFSISLTAPLRSLHRAPLAGFRVEH